MSKAPVLSLGSRGQAVKYLQARVGVNADGVYGHATAAAVKQQQAEYGLSEDGIYGPDTNRARTRLRETEISDHGTYSIFLKGKQVDYEAAAVRAVMEVETSGSGFFDDGLPKIRLERHVVYRLLPQTEHKKLPASLCYPTRGGYAPTAYDEWGRFQAVSDAVGRDVAIRASSWGLGQLMGFNYKPAGCPTPGALEYLSALDEKHQLDLLLTFIASSPSLDSALRTHDWRAFARLYNGPKFSANHYDTKLAAAYLKFARPAQ